jgi:hypothetical protein
MADELNSLNKYNKQKELMIKKELVNIDISTNIHNIIITLTLYEKQEDECIAQKETNAH